MMTDDDTRYADDECIRIVTSRRRSVTGGNGVVDWFLRTITLSLYYAVMFGTGNRKVICREWTVQRARVSLCTLAGQNEFEQTKDIMMKSLLLY